MAGIKGFSCVQCGCTELCYGYLGLSGRTFVPSGIFTAHGIRTRSYVCLHCGYIGQYIPKDNLEKLKEKFKSQLGK
jgi:hypothetical protein